MPDAANRAQDEQALQDTFAASYLLGQSPVMLDIERRVCGCDYGGVSWTVRAEADRMVADLDLRKGRRLLELGAGAGWPGLYMTKVSGCDTVLTDVIASGLDIAAGRAVRDGLSDRVETAVADAAAMPFDAGRFDAVSHSDILCCLKQKRAVLNECRRVIRPDGKMAFTVIFIAPDLSSADHARAVASGPEFVESDTGYPELLAGTGWHVELTADITPAFAATCRRLIEADESRRADLISLIGEAELDTRLDNWRTKLIALEDSLLRRAYVVAVPARRRAG